MKRITLFFALLLFAVSTLAQTYTNTKQIRFYSVTSSDTAATVANSGRGWYDFVSHKFRCNINGTNTNWTGAGGGGGLTGAINGLSTSGSNAILGGSLTTPTIITGSSTNTLKYIFGGLGVTQTDGAGQWLSNTTPATVGAQQISPSLVFEGQGWKTTATAASQSVKFALDALPVQGTTAPTGSLRFKASINGAAYGSPIADIWSDGRISIGTSSPQSSTTLTVDRFSGSNNNLFNFLTLGTSIFRLSATSNIVHVGPNSTTTGSTDFYSLSGTISASSGNPQTTYFKTSPTINYTGTTSGAIVRGFVYEPTETSITGTQQLAFLATKGALVMGKSNVDVSTTRVQITGTGTGTGYNLLTQDLSFNNRFGIQDNGKMFLFTSPTNDDTETKYLVWDSSGEVQYKNESAIGSGLYWKNAGSTTGISASLSGTASFAGSWNKTATMTQDADARPVNDAYTYVVNPASAPASTSDYHGIDYSLSAQGSNINSNVNLYPLEVTAGMDGTGTVGGLFNIFCNSRNTSTGTVTSMTGIRLRARNNSTGTVSNYYAVRMNSPINSGTFTNWYGLYIDDISGPTNIWGLYSLEQNNFTKGLQIGSSNMIIGETSSSPLTNRKIRTLTSSGLTNGGIDIIGNGVNVATNFGIYSDTSIVTKIVDFSRLTSVNSITFGSGASEVIGAANGGASPSGDSLRIISGTISASSGTGSIGNLILETGYATSGNVSQGNLILKINTPSGSGNSGNIILETRNSTGTIKLNDGSNEQMGVATLVGGTVTVNNTKITANTRIFLTTQTLGGTIGVQYISARSAGTSFTITSTSGADTSTVAWLLIEPN